jgi:hypothetical protein
MRAKWFGRLVAVSRFFCFPIQMNFAENKKWPASPPWRATHHNSAGRYMTGTAVAWPGPGFGRRVGKSKKVVKRRAVGRVSWEGGNLSGQVSQGVG